ncbi:MAG: phage holin family protein [Bacteroidales bacterium]|nr:phage holin family protein [Bacteroidales bacterium]
MSVFKINSGNKFDLTDRDFWVKIIILTISIWIVSFTALVKIEGGPLYALLAALIISLLNAFLRPVLSWISMPLVVSTLGIFMLVINAIIVLLTSWLLSPHFVVNGFWNAFFFSIIVTFLSFLLGIPTHVKRLRDDIFNQKDLSNGGESQKNNYNNADSSNRFDSDPFNDDPQQKNYTDYEDVD